MGPCISKNLNRSKKVCNIIVDTTKAMDLTKYPDEEMIFQVSMQNFVAKFHGNVILNIFNKIISQVIFAWL